MAANTAELDVLINVNTTGQAKVAALKSELAAVGGGGFLPIGGGRVNYGGSLTREEQAIAAAQLSQIETKAKNVSKGFREATVEANTFARAAGTVGAEGSALAGRMTALGAVMGSGGALTLGIGAAIIGLGGIYEAGRSIIEISERNQSATRNLASAYAYLGQKVPTKEIDDFISKNDSFINSTADAKNAFAELARAGFGAEQQQRLMNDALDLSVIHNESLTAAATELIKASQGQARSFADLGINLKNIDDPVKALKEAQGDVAKATTEHAKAVQALNHWEIAHADRSKLTAGQLDTERTLKLKVAQSTTDLKNANLEVAYAQALAKEKGDKFAALLDILEPKIKDGRDNTTKLQQSQNRLSSDWEDLANKAGPPLVDVLDDVVSSLDAAYKIGTYISNAPNPFAAWVGYVDQLNRQVSALLGLIYGVPPVNPYAGSANYSSAVHQRGRPGHNLPKPPKQKPSRAGGSLTSV